ncbi:AzlD domain-containing protein [Nakamurella endophytica]|uniref:Branched-chain amino acid transporter n=1 Tax=Nakamurella endophytica TaxID=1748367 RepID=A0A917WCM9_9ACTN|nr:AzlD domain-containing protein [Nakamurella endophytica]GGL93262.1 branched-chain amino acid transporter [Nakamurella endophytica]
MIWIAVLVASAGCYLCKLAGLSLPASVLARPAVQRVAGLMPVVLLAALVAVQTVGSGQAVVLDARLAGVAVAGVAVWRRWPFLVVVALAALTTALLRLVVPGS